MDAVNPKTDAALLKAALAAGQPLGLRWTIDAPARVADAGLATTLRLNFGEQELRFVAEIRRGLRPATLGAVLHQLALHGEQGLLVADHITPPMADELRARGVAFIDTAGNAHIARPPLLVWVKGQRPQLPLAARAPATRAFQNTGLQVLFALLCRPEAANWPYRKIAEIAGVAHGTVGWVMAELPKLGFLVEINNKRRLVEGERLLTRWVEAYPQRLRPKLMLARYHADTLDWANTIDAAAYDLLLGGEPAARRLTQHLRPGTATFYGEGINRQWVIDQRLRPDPQGNVEVLKRFWHFDHEPADMVPPLLVYADLLAIGDARCLEVARELHDGIVARFV